MYGAKTRLVKFRFADCDGRVFAGPYPRSGKPFPDTFMVNMAAEIDAASDVKISTRDFGVPEPQEILWALAKVAINLIRGHDVFVGCGYGIGRTGLFLACLYKLDRYIRHYAGSPVDMSEDIVAHVRRTYNVQAVETPEQRKFIEDLDVRLLARGFAVLLRPKILLDKRFWVS
jgi:hypothetical protein